MEVLIVLLPVSAVIILLGIAAFFWAVDHGQYDDVDNAADEALFGEPDVDIDSLRHSEHGKRSKTRTHHD